MSCLAVALGSEKAPTTSGKYLLRRRAVLVPGLSGATWVPALETERFEPLLSLSDPTMASSDPVREKENRDTAQPSPECPWTVLSAASCPCHTPCFWVRGAKPVR